VRAIPLAAVVVMAILAPVRQIRAAERGCGIILTAENLPRCALAASLAVQIASRNVEAAKGRRTAAGIPLPSLPALTVTGGALVGAGPEQGLIWSASVGQEFEVGGQRRARLDATQAEIAANALRVTAVQRDAVASAWLAYFDVLAARELVVMTEDAVKLSESLALAARGRATQGLNASVEADLAEDAVVRQTEAKLEAERALAAAHANLATLLGQPADVALQVSGQLTPLPAADSAAQPSLHRPEVEALAAEANALSARAETLRRSRTPNLTASLFTQRDRPGELAIGIGVGLPFRLPGLSTRSYAGEIAEVLAMRARVELEARQTERQITRGFAVAASEYRSRVQAVALYRPDRLAKARQTLTDIAAEMRSGRMAVREALITQQSLQDLLRAQVQARHALCVASVELARAAGLALERGEP
jgi:cobalt-zinc-cadmium efflux system outer membrane protein